MSAPCLRDAGCCVFRSMVAGGRELSASTAPSTRWLRSATKAAPCAPRATKKRRGLAAKLQRTARSRVVLAGLPSPSPAPAEQSCRSADPRGAWTIPFPLMAAFRARSAPSPGVAQPRPPGALHSVPEPLGKRSSHGPSGDVRSACPLKSSINSRARCGCCGLLEHQPAHDRNQAPARPGSCGAPGQRLAPASLARPASKALASYGFRTREGRHPPTMTINPRRHRAQDRRSAPETAKAGRETPMDERPDM